MLLCAHSEHAQGLPREDRKAYAEKVHALIILLPVIMNCDHQQWLPYRWCCHSGRLWEEMRRRLGQTTLAVTQCRTDHNINKVFILFGISVISDISTQKIYIYINSKK